MKKLGLLLVVVMLLGACSSPAPEATPTPVPTSTPAPTDTPEPLATPTSPALTETSFIEPIRKQIFNDLLDDSGSIAGEEARATVARQWGISVGAAKEIVAEGIEKGWLPTATPMPPTVTPVPPTPTPGLSAEEQAYVSEMREIIWDYAVSLGKLGDLMRQVDRYPWLINDAQWINDMVLVLVSFTIRGEKLRALEPPLRYRGSHQDYVQVSRHYDNMRALITQSLDEVNPSKMDKAMEEKNTAEDYLEQGIAKFEQESKLE